MNLRKRENIGRSMIEMIGVLALIGILSVGTLVIFTSAIEKHRVNTLINQVIQIATNTRNMFSGHNSLDYLSLDLNVKSMSVASYANRKIADKLKLFPDTIRHDGYKNLYGGEIQYFADGRFKDNDGKAFILELYSIPRDACISLVTQNWTAILGIVAMKVKGSSTDNSKNYSIQAGALTGKCKTRYKQGVGLFCVESLPVTVEQAVKVCDYEKNNNISWKFY